MRYYNPGQNSWDIKAITRKNDVFSPSPSSPDSMLMSGIQVIFGRLNIAWGKGEQKKQLTKTTSVADPDFELRRGPGLSLLAQPAFLLSVISSFLPKIREGPGPLP